LALGLVLQLRGFLFLAAHRPAGFFPDVAADILCRSIDLILVLREFPELS
jgi:hypothetical protein